MSEWISVKDGLPDTTDDYIHESKNVLLIDRNGDMYTTKYIFYSIDLGAIDNFYDDDITHWMPLPEPPKDTK